MNKGTENKRKLEAANMINGKNTLAVANGQRTPFEIYSIILRGVTCALKSIFTNYYVSENIEGLMRFINDKGILSAKEYKGLLAEAKDFYAVILCALFIDPIKKHTKNFKYNELNEKSKGQLRQELYNELYVFFFDWLCDIEIEPLLFYRLAVSYNKTFNLNLCIKSQLSKNLTAIEDRVLKLELVDILTDFLIDEVAVHLGLAGLDHIDYYRPDSSCSKSIEQDSMPDNCIDTIV